jgi:hypothetical protein
MSPFMALLTKAFIRYVDSGWRVIPTKKITPDELAGLFNIAFMKVATIEKAVKGFRNTRICPLNPDVFTEEDFLPANLEMINVENLNQKILVNR